MIVMKTSLTIIPMCPRERFPSYKSLSRLVLCYKKDWAILMHLIYFIYLLLVTIYLITKLSVIDNFNACREYLAEDRLSFPSTPHWVRHSFFTVGWATKFMCYNMNSRQVKVISNLEYGELPYLPYVPFYAELQSLHRNVNR